MGSLKGEESSCPLWESRTFLQLVSPSPCHYFDRTFMAASPWMYKVKI